MLQFKLPSLPDFSSWTGGVGGIKLPKVKSHEIENQLRDAEATWLVTVSPLLIGGAAAPTLADGPGFAPGHGPALRLVSTEQKDDEVFLRYEVP